MSGPFKPTLVPAPPSDIAPSAPASVDDPWLSFDSEEADPLGAASAADTPARLATPAAILPTSPEGSTLVVTEREGRAPARFRSTASVALLIVTVATTAALLFFGYVLARQPPGPAAGQFEVTSEPSGAAVTIDGTSRGVTPLVMTDLSPGTHDITIGHGTSTVTRTVKIEARTKATMVVMFVR